MDVRIKELAVLLQTMNVKDLPQRSVGDPGANLAQGRRVAKGEPHFGFYTCRLGQACQLECLRRIARDRLFAQHVLANFDGSRTEFGVGR